MTTYMQNTHTADLMCAVIIVAIYFSLHTVFIWEKGVTAWAGPRFVLRQGPD